MELNWLLFLYGEVICLVLIVWRWGIRFLGREFCCDSCVVLVLSGESVLCCGLKFYCVLCLMLLVVNLSLIV